MFSSSTLMHLTVFAAVQSQVSGVKIRIGDEPKQTINAFGASGAWWPNDLIHFPQSVQDDLARFLFSEDGIYLSSYRYNMGGDGGDDTETVSPWGSRVESFLLRDGTYDWSRDHAGVTFLEKAQQYNVSDTAFFINAAPSHIASNGAACGWNMTSDKVEEFVDYIQTVLSHWLDQGITIKYVSPMNEPDNNRAGCGAGGQEGMAVDPALRTDVFKAINTAKQATNAQNVGIIGDETSRVVEQALSEDPIWLPIGAQELAGIAIHNYDYPDDTALVKYYQSVQNLTNATVPPIKFTETCCSTTPGSGPDVFGAQYDPTMQNALIVARYIWQFLTLADATSFDWWTAVTQLPCSPTEDGEQCATAINETAGYNSGLVYIDGNYNETKDFNLYYTKRAFMMKHFAYFHRPGSVRYAVEPSSLPIGVNAFATLGKAQSSSEHGWRSHEPTASQAMRVLLINNQTTAIPITLSIPKGAQLKQIVETTAQVDWANISDLPQVRREIVNFELPPQSLWTLQFSIDSKKWPGSYRFK
ncbi:glycoside hydrolase family 30 protein [Polychaeton citri CBS 116435]|uniref:Glycoside hydrolase family 30 protein n=1 Tax=Polychaeton citri CBS 116435 TaxID=1314669 RepID=A0A9P4USU6_9PEZI|nr:glycoside hydrolase family 30 protein [Polychaeton citri CBS 116435]